MRIILAWQDRMISQYTCRTAQANQELFSNAINIKIKQLNTSGNISPTLSSAITLCCVISCSLKWSDYIFNRNNGVDSHLLVAANAKFRMLLLQRATSSAQATDPLFDPSPLAEPKNCPLEITTQFDCNQISTWFNCIFYARTCTRITIELSDWSTIWGIILA